jgi:hypothetical protein
MRFFTVETRERADQNKKRKHRKQNTSKQAEQMKATATRNKQSYISLPTLLLNLSL